MALTQDSIKEHQSRKILYFLTYSISFIALGLAVIALGPMLPYLAENTGVNFSQISFLFTTNNLGHLIGSAGGGRLFDRFKSHILLFLSLILMILTTIAIPLMSDYYSLLFVMFVFGLGTGLLDIGGNVSLLWVYKTNAGPFLNALHFFFGIGALLSPLILHKVMALTHGAITWPFWVIAILYIPSLIGLLLLKSPASAKQTIEKSGAEKADVRFVVLMILLFFLHVGVQAGFGGWIFTYATYENIAKESSAAYLNSLFWGALTVGRLIVIPLAKKLKPSQILLGSYGLTLFFLILMLIWPTNRLMVWVVTAGLGVAVSSVFPTLLSLAETRMTITGKITSYFFLGSSSGSMILPMLIGQIFEYYGSYEIVIALFSYAVLGLVVLVYLVRGFNRAGKKAFS